MTATTTRSALAFAGFSLIGTAVIAFLVAVDGCATDALRDDRPARPTTGAAPATAPTPAPLDAPRITAVPVRPAQPPPPLRPEPGERSIAIDLAAWDDAWAGALLASAAKYEALAKWCGAKKLPYSEFRIRALVLRYLPDDAAARADVGYVRGPDGTWVRDEARHQAMRATSDIEDPRAMKLHEKEAATNRSVVALWRRLPQQAARQVEADPPNADAWTERAARAWSRVLEADPSDEAAHKALGHPKFEGRYVLPEALPFLAARSERRRGGQMRANLRFPPERVATSGAFAAAGLAGGGARSAHAVVDSAHGADAAARLCVWTERAIADFGTVYGPAPAAAEPSAPVKLNVVPGKDELMRLLLSAGWSDADAERFASFRRGGPGVPAGESTATSAGRADADDAAIHAAGHALAAALRADAIRELGSPVPHAEDWLVESVAHDLSRPLTGTTVVPCCAFGRYGFDVESNPDADRWIVLAKRLVESDDDVPLTRLCVLTLARRELGGPETVKGYALLQFLFEWDAAKARAFVRTALAQGTTHAIDVVYHDSMDAIDARYREWLRVTW